MVETKKVVATRERTPSHGKIINISLENKKDIQALLDTGCLVGDCISQNVVDTLDASHLLYDVNTTICSGFNNECENKFKFLKI